MLLMIMKCCLMILKCCVFEKLFNDFEMFLNDLSSSSNHFERDTYKGGGAPLGRSPLSQIVQTGA